MAATPKIDRIAEAFLKKIPDEFQTAFTPGAGTAMPAGNVLTAASIMDYVNRALHKYFDDIWTDVNKAQPISHLARQQFVNIFPELVRVSSAITFTTGSYTIANPYLDLFRIIGANNSATGNVSIRVWDESRYTLALESKYLKDTPTTNNPVIMQMQGTLKVFPTSLTSILIQYIKYPVVATTGALYAQNGTEDSPFLDTHTDRIAEIAYNIYLVESHETA